MKMENIVVENKKLNKDESFLSTPDDTIRDAKAFDKWDKENNDRPQKIPTLAKGPHFNRLGWSKDIAQRLLQETPEEDKEEPLEKL